MGCCGEREKFDNPDNEQKWDYINLSDFRSSSCLTPLSYGILYIFLLISLAVYAVDLFTCVNLLFFDKWSGQVKPAIPFEISRWIFTACIILSYILLAFRWWRAIRAMKTGVVAASYLDPLAVRVQSIRMGRNGRGWRRFLVFAALTKGRKGAEYVALFTYFSFEAWLRICFAEGPRQVINALTLYSVMQADLVPTGKHAAKAGKSPVGQFFVNLQLLADKNKEQAAILFGMLFTLIIWIFSALSLIMAAIFYITFLWHHIRDGSLSRYCRRKIDTRLHKIVMVRVNRALEKDNRSRIKQAGEGVSVGPPGSHYKRQPTVPVLDPEGSLEIKPISRQTSQMDHTPADPATRASPTEILNREPTIPDVLENTTRPQLPSRSTTQSSVRSNISYGDKAPLIGSAAPIGFRPPGPDHPPARMDFDHVPHSHRPPGRRGTGMTQRQQSSFPPSAPQVEPLSRQHIEPSEKLASGFPFSQPPQFQEPNPPISSFHPMGRPSGQSSIDRRPRQDYEMHSRLPGGSVGARPPKNGGYVAFNPLNKGRRVAPQIEPRSARKFPQPQRPPPVGYTGFYPRPPQRSGSAPIPDMPHNDDIYHAYGGSWQEPQAVSVPPRPSTAGPGAWHGP